MSQKTYDYLDSISELNDRQRECFQNYTKACDEYLRSSYELQLAIITAKFQKENSKLREDIKSMLTK